MFSRRVVTVSAGFKAAEAEMLADCWPDFIKQYQFTDLSNQEPCSSAPMKYEALSHFCPPTELNQRCPQKEQKSGPILDKHFDGRTPCYVS